MTALLRRLQRPGGSLRGTICSVPSLVIRQTTARRLHCDVRDAVDLSSLLALRQLQRPGKPDGVARIVSQLSGRERRAPRSARARRSHAAMRRRSSARRTP